VGISPSRVKEFAVARIRDDIPGLSMQNAAEDVGEDRERLEAGARRVGQCRATAVDPDA